MHCSLSALWSRTGRSAAPTLLFFVNPPSQSSSSTSDQLKDRQPDHLRYSWDEDNNEVHLPAYLKAHEMVQWPPNYKYTLSPGNYDESWQIFQVYPSFINFKYNAFLQIFRVKLNVSTFNIQNDSDILTSAVIFIYKNFNLLLNCLYQ